MRAAGALLVQDWDWPNLRGRTGKVKLQRRLKTEFHCDPGGASGRTRQAHCLRAKTARDV